MKIVLASESEFRKRAMDMLGVAYQICPSGIDEKSIRDDNPAELTLKLAEAKARKAASECADAVVISGDAVASKGNKISLLTSSMERGREDWPTRSVRSGLFRRTKRM